jgi:hypothetical protein
MCAPGAAVATSAHVAIDANMANFLQIMLQCTQLVSVENGNTVTEPSSSKVANFNKAQWFQLFVPHFAQGQPPPEFH